MPAVERKVQVCDHCYSFHQCYMPDQPFNFSKKEGITTCTLCDEHNVICADCYNHSKEELKESILADFGMVICRKCLVEVWRVSDTQERLEDIAMRHIEAIKKSMRKAALFLTKSLQ
jgi:hypothetical protein